MDKVTHVYFFLVRASYFFQYKSFKFWVYIIHSLD